MVCQKLVPTGGDEQHAAEDVEPKTMSSAPLVEAPPFCVIPDLIEVIVSNFMFGM